MITDFERARKCIGQGYLTNSKNPATDFPDFVPTHWSMAKGAHIYDAKMNPYVDLVCGLGAIHYGHQAFEPEPVQLLSGSSRQEIITAECIKQYIPWIEKVKFVNDGSEACAAAVRMARTFTGRGIVYSEGYHGWLDEFTGLNDNCVGIPQAMRMTMEKFKLEDYASIPAQAAAVILEPVQCDDSPERISLLFKLRKHCTENGIILIFDEVITGLRYPMLSVASYHTIYPDLICMGKAFGNGEKTGFVGGLGKLLDSDYFVSGTYFGQINALAAIEESLLMSKKYDPEVLCNRAKTFNWGFNEIAPEVVKILAWGTRGIFCGSDEHVAIFRQEMFREKFFTKSSIVWNWANIQYGVEFLRAANRIIPAIKTGRVKLEYPLPEKPLSATMRKET